MPAGQWAPLASRSPASAHNTTAHPSFHPQGGPSGCPPSFKTPLRRSRVASLHANPFSLWTDLALKTSAMLFASAYVIGHRTGRMALAGPRPSARDQREFTLMSQEKIDAAIASATAMSMQSMRVNMNIGARFAEQMWGTTHALMSLGSSRTPSQAFARQGTLARALARAPQSATDMLHSTARVMQHGLKPIHARATANSRRLRKL